MKLLKDSPGGFWQLNKCGGQVPLWAAGKNERGSFIYVEVQMSQREYPSDRIPAFKIK